MNMLPDLPCFYDPNFKGGLGELCLPSEEVHHALKVLRLTAGSEFIISNGLGSIAICHVAAVGRNELTYKTDKLLKNGIEQPFNIDLACGVLGSSTRMEWLVEKAVEIGVGKIIFFETQRTKKKRINESRLVKTAVSALKQSRKAYLPEVIYVSFNKLIELEYKTKLAAICDGKEYEPIAKLNDGGKRLIVIGPEGDFTTEEISLLKDNNFKPCSLGNERLRSETAALYALATQKQID